MNSATKVLCNGFPRTVAFKNKNGLKQTFVHSESEFDVFTDYHRESSNMYMNISRFREDMRVICHDFPFDFDSPVKTSAFPNDPNEAEKIQMMRENEELAEEVLGEVWEDTQRLVEYAWDENIPVISIFSGMGVHSHLLFKEQVEPTKEKISTSEHIIQKLGLSTYDRQIVTDIKRVLRIPNSKRFDGTIDTNTYCIPMTEVEVLNNTIHDLLERCKKPKDIEIHSRYIQENRPEMQVYDDVDINENTYGSIPLKENRISEDVEYILDTCIPLPCVRKRFSGPNPHHRIRFTGVIHLYQAGFTPAEVRSIIKKIGWVDYDKDITHKMTEQIWNRRYSELPCDELRRLGLCIYGPQFEEMPDEPSECETYKYHSGKALYPYEN